MKNKDIDDLFRKYKSNLDVPSGFGKLSVAEKVKIFNKLSKSKSSLMAGFVKDYNELKGKAPAKKQLILTKAKEKKDKAPTLDTVITKNKYGSTVKKGKVYKPPKEIGGERTTVYYKPAITGKTKPAATLFSEGSAVGSGYKDIQKANSDKTPNDRAAQQKINAKRIKAEKKEKAKKDEVRAEEAAAGAKINPNAASEAAASIMDILLGNTERNTGLMREIQRIERPSDYDKHITLISGKDTPTRPKYHWSQEGSRYQKREEMISILQAKKAKKEADKSEATKQAERDAEQAEREREQEAARRYKAKQGDVDIFAAARAMKKARKEAGL